MISVGAQGFALGLTLIVAIGAQNAFVLRQGLMRRHVGPVVALCALADATLIVAGVAGLGTLVQRSPTLLTVIGYAGAAFLIAYGCFALRRAFKPEAMALEPEVAHENRAQQGERERASPGPSLNERSSLNKALLTVAAFTFLNPHVYLDTVVLFGGLSARFEGAERLAFGFGGVVASLVWFVGLGYGARFLAPVFAKPRAWQVLDIAIAAIMFLIAWKVLSETVGSGAFDRQP